MTSNNFLPTFRDNLTVPNSRVKNKKTDGKPARSPKRTPEIMVRVLNYGSRNSFWITEHWRWDPIGCPETSVTNNYYKLRSNPDERSSHLIRRGSLKSSIATFMLFIYIQNLFSHNLPSDLFLFNTQYTHKPLHYGRSESTSIIRNKHQISS